MAGCGNCSATFALNGQNGLAEIHSIKSLSLREIADTTKRLSAPPAVGVIKRRIHYGDRDHVKGQKS